MRITLVKKILADGSLCAKCRDVEQKLKENDQEKFLDQVLIADERDPQSPGMQMAQRLNVQRAPFFVVEAEGQEPEVYTVYFKFVKEVLNKASA
ncbi:hypothetical protein PVT68_01770 [Microbulbifer bruguierae]|uniref:Thioredoxin-like fold domain-containing protein n=1 Tax=Microbulbifer bruguierae TaxID=3029061 RepID=A0ABY8NDP2_9GAMM|nr:hypothetical protein [Microbulbifer bruguierae]WGL17040.1 hypothetical protein PVT68_01770 [Microbulbifer bruguierae]